MKEILQENSDAVRQAGEALVEIGTELAAGRIENALGRLEAAQQQYRAWEELDQAIIDIQEAVHDRKNTLAVQQILVLGLELSEVGLAAFITPVIAFVDDCADFFHAGIDRVNSGSCIFGQRRGRQPDSIDAHFAARLP